MKPSFVIPIAALSAAIFASNVEAQSVFNEAESAARNLSFENRDPFGGLSEFGWLSQAWSVNTFFAMFRGQYPNQTKFWIVRRLTGSRDQTNQPLWADSRSCPAVEQMLIAMERLPSVRPDAPQLGEEAANIGLVMDGTQHIFWNRGARSGANNASVGLEVTGNVNSPIAEWWADSTLALSSCWRETPPA